MNIRTITLILVLAVILTTPVQAVVIPSFPACTDPQGSKKVSYSDGTHGIVGSTATYEGSDTVYTLDGDRLVQCFCPKSGATGVQSNWWKAVNLSNDDIGVLKNDGWNYVPNGALWGLENAPYVVKNNEYACLGTGGGEIASGVSQKLDVLGLASTGDVVFVLGSGISAVAFLLLGIYVYRQTRK
ncbi:MAG: hypothetical protein AAB874_00400 [Patescibacteria group bacterium]